MRAHVIKLTLDDMQRQPFAEGKFCMAGVQEE